MIVRIATEGQYRLPDESLARLNDLDDAELASSDLILPPPDLSFDEAVSEFSAEGLIPD